MFSLAFSIVAPIFALVGVGYGAGRLKWISADAATALSEFVFVLAIPALLFRTLARSEFPAINPVGYWLTYFLALAVSWGLASVIARKMGRSSRESAVIGFSAAQANTVLVGIPLILKIYGEAGSVPILLLIGVHLPITMSVVALLIARGEHKAGAGAKLLKSLAMHPILLAIFAGILWRLTGFELAEPVFQTLKFLGDAAAPTALVAMGLSMTRVSLDGNRLLIGVVVACKLLIHPALVYVLAVHVFHLSPLFTGVAMLFAACPTGINAYLVSDRYQAGQDVASGSIAVSTVLAIVTVTIVVAYVTMPR
jgi:malonate transporter and related proteins